jgi:hypothetical protein
MEKILEAIKLLKEASGEMEKSGLTLEWNLEIKPYFDLLSPLLAESKSRTALPHQESAGTEKHHLS